MVKVERRKEIPASLQAENLPASSTAYKNPDVIEALREDFHKKCYICEVLPTRGFEVEHLRPHEGGKRKEMMFAWGNLFPACKHCNNIKNNDRYKDKILDCCADDPEKFMTQRYVDGRVEIMSLAKGNEKAVMTAELIQACFENRSTGIRTAESQDRVDALTEVMGILLRTLSNYRKTGSNRNLASLRNQLAKASQFAAFKRQYVRDNLRAYPGLAEFV